MKVLCREDCKGICNRCGTNLNLRTCTCDTRSLDPRMSVIRRYSMNLRRCNHVYLS
ncbi:MAG: YceD family protein [Clostridium fessum]